MANYYNGDKLLLRDIDGGDIASRVYLNDHLHQDSNIIFSHFMDLNNISSIAHDSSFLRSHLTTFQDNLNIGHFNAQSFNIHPSSSKLAEIKNIIEGSLLSIVGVSATWLKPHNVNVDISGYTVYRNDRPVRRGGGVALFVSGELNSKVVHIVQNYDVAECLFVEVTIARDKMLIGVAYLSHGDFESFEAEVLELLVRYSHVIIMGDFNNNLFDLAKSYNVRRACTRLGLTVMHKNIPPTHVDVFHHSSSLLDYFLVSSPSRLRLNNQFFCPDISRHAFIFMSYDFTVPQLNSYCEYYDYENYDENVLHSHIMSTDFSPILLTSDVDIQLNILMQGINFIHSAFPKRRRDLFVRSRDNWLKSPSVRYSQSLSDLAYRAFLANRDQENWRAYCRARNRAKSSKRREKKKCHTEMFSRCEGPKTLWGIIRENGLIGEDKRDCDTVDVDELNSTFLQKQLNTVGETDHIFGSAESEGGFSFSCISHDELITAFSSIKSNAPGNHGLPLKFFKIIFPHICGMLLHLVNTIIMTSTFPAGWKTAKINPIRKKSDNVRSDSYRPISLLPILSKITEYVLKVQLNAHLEQRNLLSDYQCGFRCRRSTSMGLLGLTEAIRLNISSSQVSSLLSLDLEKAFDKVDHCLLIHKLHSIYGFSTVACKLLLSYLTGRSQFVQLNDKCSQILSVRSGVPQGSVLGPLLFILFIDDLFNEIDDFCLPFSYADDIQLLFTGEVQHIDVLQAKMDFVMKSLFDWMNSNHFSINATKTKALFFPANSCRDLHLNYNGVLIESVRSIKCLGVTVDDKLCFEHHIDNIVRLINMKLRQLYNSDLMLPYSVREKLIHALVMPHLLYCIEVYSGTTGENLRKVKLAVNRVVRYLYSLGRFDHVSDYVRRFLGCSFSDFVDLRSLLLFYKIFKTQTPLFLVNLFAFGRSRRNQLIIPTASQYMNKSFHVRIGRLYNSLPNTLKHFDLSYNTYRKKLLQYFTSA
ncbi:uncharacterized protein LOC142242814 [Haematobia irritans]|uniref:uncharacterized protein LOC142242814 n=1 Tax=Haematobia irritans TaxID=7368 RepID=UPI003F50BA1D